MKKKLIIAAVGAALVAGVGIAQADVKISGTMDVSVDNIKGKEGAFNQNVSKTNVSSNSSNIVFGGSEDLGNGMAAVWSVQTFVRLDNSSSTFGNGNTYVGFGSPYGTVIAGKHDTPVKLLGRAVDMFGNHLGDSRNIIDGSYSTGGIVGWDLRPQNVVGYISPTMAGVTAIVAKVTNLDDGASVHNNISAVSGLVQWANGPYYVGAGYERHHANVIGTSDPTIARVVGKATFAGFTVAGLYQQTKDNTGVGGADDNQNAYGIGGSYAFLNEVVKVQYYATDKFASVDGTKAKMIAVGFDHNMSKNTTVYVDYAQTKNGSASSNGMAGGGHGDDPGSVVDTTMSGYGVGLITKF